MSPREQPFRVLDAETQEALNALDDVHHAYVCGFVEGHESSLDCSDGATIALAKDRQRLKNATHSCCGWEEATFTTAGVGFVVGSCYGH